MSDPVSNAEIEDVLSSIRRLVSAEPVKNAATPSEKSAKPGGFENAPEDSASDDLPSEPSPLDEARLVLSQSFRVETPQEDQSTPSENEEDEAADKLTLEQWRVSSEEDSNDLIENDVMGGGPKETHETASKTTDDALWDVDVSEASAEQTLVSSDDIETDAAQENGEAVEASQTSEPESNTAIGEGLDAQPFALASAVDRFDLVTAAKREGAQASLEQTSSEREDETTSELEARIAEVEAAVAATHDEWEPDDIAQDDYAAGPTEPVPWDDYVNREPEEAVTPAPEVDTEKRNFALDAATAEKTPPKDSIRSDSQAASVKDTSDTTSDADLSDVAAWYTEDAVLDEAALRDLVSEIVRQELQGTLGERITRNVRKLVRREIHRAMLGQDFD